jgi:hypothetical protein
MTVSARNKSQNKKKKLKKMTMKTEITTKQMEEKITAPSIDIMGHYIINGP